MATVRSFEYLLDAEFALADLSFAFFAFGSAAGGVFEFECGGHFGLFVFVFVVVVVCVVWDSFIFVRCDGDDGTSKCKICEKRRGAEFLNRSSSLVREYEPAGNSQILRCCRKANLASVRMDLSFSKIVSITS